LFLCIYITFSSSNRIVSISIGHRGYGLCLRLNFFCFAWTVLLSLFSMSFLVLRVVRCLLYSVSKSRIGTKLKTCVYVCGVIVWFRWALVVFEEIYLLICFLRLRRDMDYILAVIVLLGVVLRCMVSLHPYSGNLNLNTIRPFRRRRRRGITGAG